MISINIVKEIGSERQVRIGSMKIFIISPLTLFRKGKKGNEAIILTDRVRACLPTDTCDDDLMHHITHGFYFVSNYSRVFLDPAVLLMELSSIHGSRHTQCFMVDCSRSHGVMYHWH